MSIVDTQVGPAGAVVPAVVIDAIQSMRRPVIIAHVVPDADALGSMYAMARGFGDNGCQPLAAVPVGSLSQRLGFMAEWAGVGNAGPDDFEQADGFIVLDTAKKPRCNVPAVLKDADWSAGRRVVNIDHHETNTQFGDINWVVAEATSCCELVYRVLAAAGRPIDPTTASLLYAGIYADTIGFSLPTTTAGALEAAADLVRRGADVGDLGERLSRSQRPSEFNLLRVIYANTKVIAGGRVAYSTATFEDIHNAGCTAADIDDQVGVVRSLDGVRVAMLLTEGNRGKTRINFRSSGDINVLELAKEFNGGGHNQSAGAVLECGLAEAVAKVLPRAEALVARHA